MKLSLSIISLLLSLAASCQNKNESLEIATVKNCAFESKVLPDTLNPEAIFVTPLMQKDNAGAYAFRKKGPHNLNMLVLKEASACNVINKDSSSSHIRKEVEQFSKRNNLSSKEQKRLNKKIQEYIIDFKESTYIN